MTKKDVLFGLAVGLNSPEMPPINKIILLTPAGLISADFVLTDDKENEQIDLLRGSMKVISRAFNGAPDDAHINHFLIGDEDSIMPKNVIILTSHYSKINIPSMVLYYKDIIGISIGNLDS